MSLNRVAQSGCLPSPQKQFRGRTQTRWNLPGCQSWPWRETAHHWGGQGEPPFVRAHLAQWSPLCPSSVPWLLPHQTQALPSGVYLGEWGQLSAYFCVPGSFRVPHPADAWAGLYISGVAYLNHRPLFLEDYKRGGWGEA